MQTRETGHAHRPRPQATPTARAPPPHRRCLQRRLDLRVLNPPGQLPGSTMRRLTLPPGLLASGIAHRAPPHPGHHRHQLGNPSTCRPCARLHSQLRGAPLLLPPDLLPGSPNGKTQEKDGWQGAGK